jgi:hypothetical protein
MDIIEAEFRLNEFKGIFCLDKGGSLYVVQSFETGLVKVVKGRWIWSQKIVEEKQVTSLVTVSAKDVNREADTYLSKRII